jgi:hypothetical protein
MHAIRNSRFLRLLLPLSLASLLVTISAERR